MEESSESEILIIKNTINEVLSSEGIDLSNIGCQLLIGEYNPGQPNVIGCFKENNSWYYYVTDDRLQVRVNGPVSLQTAISACIRDLPIKMDVKKNYRYDKEDLDAMFTSYTSREEAILNGTTKK